MRRDPARLGSFFCCGLLLALATAGGSWAIVCAVPSQRASIQIAVNDASCTTINVAAGTYYETLSIQRSLVLKGAGAQPSTITGLVHVSGAAVEVQLVNLRLGNTVHTTPCYLDGLKVDGGAMTDTLDVEVVNGGSAATCDPGSLLFADGFESADTSRWSNTSGRSRAAATASVPPSP